MLYSQNKTSNENVKNITELYGSKGERIAFRKLEDIPWDKVPNERIKTTNYIPNVSLYQVSFKEEFKNQVLIEANKLGYTLDSLTNMEPLDLINTIARIDTNRINYEEEVPEEYGFLHRANDRLKSFTYTGKGDCDKFTTTFSGIFS
jgi:hypothetical protein